ncbi:polynucleotide adenylyltransferase PcnB [Candidatus Symbiobacter mobilis]|uniref:Poly(A) polymerase I n=1 Tax=Candidatus Symbiobacter mobilis CR TaxID=946483 RepID=U5NAA8_9BURK|nr:polynucleotide adenylyltransferase PcnB [Candidatus Symbiobacter mobilis]AGX87124.1 tRNA nucleotidyltransferase [Candidatus Symbiobacter mobilis CR]
MIKTFIQKIFGRSRNKLLGKRVEIGPQGHSIRLDRVDERAVQVVRTLKNAGYEAYIVGGAVRDLMLGLSPKDFDVATNATPEEVKALFRRAFIIGRRFRIVHVVFGRGRDHEVVEVSTFRAYLDHASAEPVAGNEKTSRRELAGVNHAVDATGRVLRDNVWGTQEEDAARRDFSINAMYYDPERNVVVDYHKGFDDARNRVIRMIGNPTARYREDPVRALRAVRFAAKLHALGFVLDPGTASPLAQCRNLLRTVPLSRMFDEVLKLLQTGHALASIEKLQELGLARGIDPLLDLIVERAQGAFVRSALLDTDRRVERGRPVAPSFLLACVLWEDVRAGWQRRLGSGQSVHEALLASIDEVFDARIGDVSGRGRLASDMREMWAMQPRFDRRSTMAPLGLVEQPRFRAAFDFLRLRAEVGEVEEVLVDWWEKFSQAHDSLRRDMIDEVRLEQQRGKQPPRARKPRRAAPLQDTPVDGASPQGSNIADLSPPVAVDVSAPMGSAEVAASSGVSSDSSSGTAPPKKRRRRRSPPKPAAGELQDRPD